MPNDPAPTWEQLLSLMRRGPLDVLAASAANTSIPTVHSGPSNGNSPAATSSGDSQVAVQSIPPVHSGLSSQIVKPTTEDVSAMKELGEKAAEAQDEIAAIMDPINKRLKDLKEQLLSEVAAQVEALETTLDQTSDELLKRMLKHGLKAIRVSDRPPIEVVTKRDKSLTQKELLRILGKPEGMRVWNSIEEKEKHSLKIPKPTPPES